MFPAQESMVVPEVWMLAWSRPQERFEGLESARMIAPVNALVGVMMKLVWKELPESKLVDAAEGVIEKSGIMEPGTITSMSSVGAK